MLTAPLDFTVTFSFLSFPRCRYPFPLFSLCRGFCIIPNSARQKPTLQTHTHVHLPPSLFFRVAEVHVTEKKNSHEKMKGPCCNPSPSLVSARSLDAVRFASARGWLLLVSQLDKGPFGILPICFFHSIGFPVSKRAGVADWGVGGCGLTLGWIGLGTGLCGTCDRGKREGRAIFRF